ncbi:MAG: adenylate/guanylate cyclase domain-containing protein, partial [Elusimicrobia bacterium]|nr:adenylate/guanylate cyclase domain-containing protein [Elusimicrobiota bacterium]
MSDSEGKKPKSRFPIYFAAGFSVVLSLLSLLGHFDLLESHWIDRLFVFHGERMKDGDPRITIAAIDDDSIKEHGWPFSRDVHAKLINRLVALDAKTIAFDVMFLDPERSRSGGDQDLIDATRRSRRTVHVGVATRQEQEVGDQKITLNQARLPIPGLLDASLYLGHPNVDEVIDGDGHIRRMKLFSDSLDDPKGLAKRWPTYDGAALAAFEGKSPAQYEGELDPLWRLFYLNFRRPREWPIHPYERSRNPKSVVVGQVVAPYQHISVGDIVANRLTRQEKDAIRGGLVMVGSTAIGAFDHYASPFNKHTPGVEFHALMVDNMLHGDWLRDVSRGRNLAILLAFIWVPLLLARLPPVAGFGAIAAIVAGWIGFTQWRFLSGVRYDFVTPALGLVASFIVVTVQRVLKEGAEKRAIQQTFGRFVSPDVVKDLAANPENAKIGARERNMTVFFLDIAHFTTISEKLKSTELFEFLNVYLSALTEVVEQEQKGTVDKYIGDCIMAFWNA